MQNLLHWANDNGIAKFFSSSRVDNAEAVDAYFSRMVLHNDFQQPLPLWWQKLSTKDRCRLAILHMEKIIDISKDQSGKWIVQFTEQAGERVFNFENIDASFYELSKLRILIGNPRSAYMKSIKETLMELVCKSKQFRTEVSSECIRIIVCERINRDDIKDAAYWQMLGYYYPGSLPPKISKYIRT